MGWAISTHGIKSVNSFEAARKHWESQAPWRNEHTHWRPLAGRRETHKRLEQIANEAGYACVLYQTALVTYYADGSVALKTHDSESSISFAWCVTPRGCSPISHKKRMFWKVKTDEGDRYYAEGKSPLILKPTPSGNWNLVTQPAAHQEWRLDRKKAAAVQKLLRPYVQWYRTTERLGAIQTERRFSQMQPGSSAVVRLQEMVTSPENFPAVARSYGSPDVFRPVIYEATGARIKVPVMHTSLPKEFA